jgi:hypothetical protein
MKIRERLKKAAHEGYARSERIWCAPGAPAYYASTLRARLCKSCAFI